MKKKIVITGAFFAMIAVILGALGAHWLKGKLLEPQLQSFETAVRYLMYHSLALLFVGFAKEISSKWVSALFISGTILFSGSIFLLSTQDITGMQLSFMGPITPIGGLLLICGWALLIYKVANFKLGKE